MFRRVEFRENFGIRRAVGWKFGCGEGTGRGKGEPGTGRGEDGWLGGEREKWGGRLDGIERGNGAACRRENQEGDGVEWGIAGKRGRRISACDGEERKGKNQSEGVKRDRGKSGGIFGRLLERDLVGEHERRWREGGVAILRPRQQRRLEDSSVA